MFEKLNTIRLKINELNERLALIEPHYLPREAALERIDKFIADSKDKLHADIGGLYTRSPDKARMFSFGEEFGLEDKSIGTDFSPLLATFMGEQFKEWLISKADERVGDRWGLSNSEYQERQSEILEQLLKLECEEEEEISNLEESGQVVSRRPNIRFPLISVLNNPTQHLGALL